MFLSAVVLAGVLQTAFSFTRAGVLSEFVPSSVITGMLAAIGLILILKQVPHLVGLDSDYVGSFEFVARDGGNTLSTLMRSLTETFVPGAVLIGGAALAFLFWWDGARPKQGSITVGAGASGSCARRSRSRYWPSAGCLAETSASGPCFSRCSSARWSPWRSRC